MTLVQSLSIERRSVPVIEAAPAAERIKALQDAIYAAQRDPMFSSEVRLELLGLALQIDRTTAPSGN